LVLIKKPDDCPEFTALDGCCLRELLHNKNDAVDLPYSLAAARVEAGRSTCRHRLEGTEIYYILEGSGCMHVDDEERDLAQGEAALIPPGAVQWIENTGAGELRFLAIVSPPWSEEGDQRLE